MRFAPATQQPSATWRAAKSFVDSGQALLKQGRAAEAVPLLEMGLAAAPNPDRVKPLLALALDASGDTHKARLIWMDLAKSSNVDWLRRHKVFWRLGKGAIDRGDYPSAVALIQRHLALASDDTSASNSLLQARLAAAPLEERQRIYDAHVRALGETSESLVLLATFVRIYESTDLAIAALEQAEAIASGSAQAWIQIARAYQKIGQPSKALSLLDRAARKDPHSRQIMKARVRALDSLGASKDQILEPVVQLAEAEPGEASYKALRGRVLKKFNDWPGSAAAFEEALSLDPYILAHWEGALSAYTSLERDERIEALLSEARTLFRKRGHPGLVDLAKVEIAGQCYPEAVAVARKALGNPATKQRARHALAEAMVNSGAYIESWTYLSAALQEQSTEDDLRRLAARCGSALRMAARGGEVPHFPGVLFTRALLDPPSGPVIEATDTVMLVTSSLGAGGAERQVALTSAGVSLARAGKGRTVLVGLDLTPSRGRSIMRSLAETDHLEIDDLALFNEAVVFRTIAAQDPAARKVLQLIGSFPKNLSRDIIKLYDCFRRHRPSLVHLWQDGVISTGSVAAVLAGVPRMVCSMRNVVASESDRRRYRPYLATMYKALATKPNVSFTANSAAGAKDYEAWLGMPAGTIGVLRNGVNVAAIRSRAPKGSRPMIRERLNLPDDALLVGGVFRLAPAKRPHLWLDVVSRVAASDPRVRGVIVGDGAMRDEIQSVINIKGLQDRITLAGRQSPVEPWMSAMDVLLLASEVEGLPNVLLEAESLGVPVVTTEAGGSGEALLDGVIGVLVQDDSPENLAAAVMRVTRSQSMRHRARVGAPAFVEQRFGLDRMLRETLTAYGETDPLKLRRAL